MGMKKTEVGMIPEEWNVQTFSDTFRILNNNTFSRAELNYESGQFKNIHYGDVLIRFPEVLDCTRLDVPYINDDCRISGSAQALQDGDVVIADTAEDETVGKVTEVRNTVKKPVMAGLHTIPCRVKSGEFAPMWLGYYMNSHLYHDQLLPYIHGIKVSSISKASLSETIIISPPVEEQEKIVAALSDIDALMWNTEKLIRKYQSVKQACLQRMFPQKGQNEPEMRLPGFTGAWEQRKVSSLAGETYGGGTPKTTVAEFWNGDIPWIQSSDITEHEVNYVDPKKYISEEAIKKSATKLVPENSIAVVTRVGVGKLAIMRFPYATSQDFLSLSNLNTDLQFTAYLLYKKIQSESNAVQGTSIKGITKEELLNKNVMTPTLPEQEKIGDYFFNLDTLITLHQRKLKKYKDIKQGMMEELLTGKVRLS